MRLVIKFAGALLEPSLKSSLRSLAGQVVELAKRGHEILIVHGGGRTFTATLARIGLKSRFVDGLRVTDRETRDVALMVLGGLLNRRLAGAISAAGQPAVGLAAVDGGCFTARPLANPPGLGFVGDLTSVNVEFLEFLWGHGVLPVAASLGVGYDGEVYNLNADQMAAASAASIGADRL